MPFMFLLSLENDASQGYGVFMTQDDGVLAIWDMQRNWEKLTKDQIKAQQFLDCSKELKYGR